MFKYETITNALGGKTTYTYDVNGNITEEVDELGNVTKNTYDKLNRVIAQTDVLNRTSTYEYDELGRTIKEMDASGGIRMETKKKLQMR